eukprot:CAMPEP_0170570854 /NCGR_PEP_ID=MMETSP0224-20130122/1339_1 /TAXON_ID=285029 /ORGANISM="Togula jolla, Strain CCCM 725" /LENGTH=90 /DNA_ID=CAMNT_0010893173 /DNA_START=1005 /DNA_END=1277 /DNA_ORIENTATION=-
MSQNPFPAATSKGVVSCQPSPPKLMSVGVGLPATRRNSPGNVAALVRSNALRGRVRGLIVSARAADAGPPLAVELIGKLAPIPQSSSTAT